MTARAAAAVLDLTLTPNRSWGKRETAWLVGGVGGLFALGGIRLLLLGAWPVLPFMAVDTGLLWWAFRASHRSGRAYERVRLADGELTVSQVGAGGSTRVTRFEAYWTRVRLDRASNWENQLWLEARGRSLNVGAALSPAEREDVFQVIERALAGLRPR